MGQKYQLKIFTFSDTHGSLLDESYATKQKLNHSLSKLSTYIKSNREQESLVIDCGDTIQGSPILYFHQLFRDMYPHPTADLFNHLKVDYFVPGNHDFNYGYSYLERFIHELDAKTLSANILSKTTNQPIASPYDIKTLKNGIKIGIIGLTTDYIPNWERKENIQDIEFSSPLIELNKIIPILEKEKVQTIIVIYHGGFERDLDTSLPYVMDTLENVGSRILDRFPQIDVLLTGHQHRLLCQKIHHTIVIQPGSNGRALGEVVFDYEYFDAWKQISSSAKLVDSIDLEPDPSFSKILEKIQEDTNSFLDQPIGFVPNDDLKIDNLFEARLKKHKIVTFINQIQLLASKAMISATSLGNDITGFQKEITIRNVLSTYVYPNTLTVVKITGDKLKEALEKNAEYFVIKDGEFKFHPKFSYPKMEHYNYDMFDGIYYTIHVNNETGHKISDLKYAGKPIEDEDEFTLVLNNYRANGGGEFMMYQGLEIIKEIPLDIAELMVDYIREKRNIVVPNINNIKVVE